MRESLLYAIRWQGLPSHRAEGLGASAALHLVAFMTLAVLPSPAPIPGDNSSPILTFVDQDAIARPEERESEAPPASAPAPREGTADDTSADAQRLAVAGIEVDVAKVRQQRDTLFAFVTAPLPFVDEVSSRLEARPGRLVNPFGRETRRSGKPPLRLGASELQRVIDRAWSRQERWDSFAEIASLIEKHDPDAGDAAAVVQGHVDQNLLQPYNDARNRDPRFWVTLALAADHQRLIEFVGRYARAHPSSRVTTELLFMLDEFTQASRDALIMLLATDPWRLLAETRAADPAAFDLAVSLRDQYARWAREQGLDRTATIRARFDQVRIRLLETILLSTPDGYGASDARFLLGRIYFDRNDVANALRWWRDLGDDGRGSYAEASAAVGREVAFPGGPSVAALSAILGAEYRRWLTSSAERLAQFGHTFDTF